MVALQVTTDSVSSLDEEGEDDANARKERDRTGISESLSLIVDVNEVVDKSAEDVSTAESIQCPVVDTGVISGNYSCSVESNVCLKRSAILLMGRSEYAKAYSQSHSAERSRHE